MLRHMPTVAPRIHDEISGPCCLNYLLMTRKRAVEFNRSQNNTDKCVNMVILFKETKKHDKDDVGRQQSIRVAEEAEAGLCGKDGASEGCKSDRFDRVGGRK